MGTNSPGTPKKCRLILQQCLAIQLTKPGHPPEDFWMYDSGYTIFQNFLSANLQCWWNAPLAAATKVLRYLGHISPGMLLITAEPCALEIIRSAYARSVLKPPATYLICSVGDIDDCIVTPIVQTQFTPLTEALCDVIMELTSQGQSATVEHIRTRLRSRFTHMQQPSVEVIYDTLVQLMQEIKIYQTSKGYFIVTPEKRRSKSKPNEYNSFASGDESPHHPPQKESKTMLMSSHEALRSLYGEISTERDGDLTHQCIQTNLADVICGGNPNDKILYPRSSSGAGINGGGGSGSKQRSASLAGSHKTLERRHSLRIFGSSKRLQRSASTRSLSKNYAQTISKDTTAASSSSSENQSNCDTKKQASSQSLLSRIFRRSTRSKSKTKQIETYSAQFPPPEWFNSKTTHLHSVGTQTMDYLDMPPIKSRLMNSTFYDSSDVSQRSLSLPRRRHHRRNLSSESTFFISSRDCSPVRRGKSPSYYCGSLPRSIHSTPASSGYYKVSRSKQQLSSSDKLHSNSQNKIESSKQLSTSRVGSGPSSIDSGKMTYITSGPSSFDSEKLSSTRTSTHSSLESHVSAATVTTTIQQQSTTSSYFIANDMKPSYVSSGSSSKDRPPPAPAVTTTTTNGSSSSSKTNNNQYKGFETTFGYNNQAINTSTNNNNHSNSSSNHLVKNSLNALCNEAITNNGILKLDTDLPSTNGQDGPRHEQLSALNETLLNFKLHADSGPPDLHELNRYNKNIQANQENTPMNNSKTLPSTPPVQPANFFYKNVLKNIQHDAKNICGDLATDKDFPPEHDHQSNLRRSNSEIKKLNSNPNSNNNPASPEKISGLIVMKKSLSVSSEPNLANQETTTTNKITILLKDTDKPNNSDRRFSFQNKEDPMIDEIYCDFPSLTDLSFNFTSLAAQKILQGRDASINSIDTLVELNINQEKQQTIMKLKNDAARMLADAPPEAKPDYGMV